MTASRSTDLTRTSKVVGHDRYLVELRLAFADAALRTSLREHDFLVGDTRIRVAAAGTKLAGMVSALPLEAAGDAAPDCTLYVWDDVSTGSRLPPFPWLPSAVGRQGAINGWNGDRVRAVYHGSVNEPPHYGFNALSLFDGTTGDAFFWVSSVDRVPWMELLEPLRPILHWTLARRGQHLLHAAAVATDAGAVILAGSGFAGKTTTTMACVLAGLQFLGDNYVVLSHDSGAPLVHSVYPNIKLRADGPSLLPHLDRTDLDSIGDRAVFDVAKLRPKLFARTREVTAVVVVRQTPGPTRLIPISGADAMVGLVPSTIYQLPANNGAALRPMADLLRTVPSYALETGPDPASAARALAELLEHA